MKESSEVVRRLEKISEQLEEMGVLKEQMIKVINLYSDLVNTDDKPLKNDLLSVKQAAEYLQVAVGTIYHLRTEGTIKSYKTGKFIRFKRSDLDDYLLCKASKSKQDITDEANDYCLRRTRK